MNSPPPFIALADAHLRGLSDPRQQDMVEFLDTQRPKSSGLLLLGDFFDYLAGFNRAAALEYGPVLAELSRWPTLHIVEGNHDFDLPKTFPGFESSFIHPSLARLTVHGQGILAFHGDRSNTKDHGTWCLRRVLQSAPLRFARDVILPDAWVLGLAFYYASRSRKRNQSTQPEEVKAGREQAIQALTQPSVRAVLYGHTHQAHLERTAAGVIANPGPAVRGGSFLSILAQGIQLCRFPDGAVLAEAPWIEAIN